MRKFIYFVVVIFFIGCAKLNPDTDFLKNEILAYTQKFEYIKDSNRYLAVGTYLNPIDGDLSNREEIEYFILSTYPREINPKNIKINNQVAEFKQISDDDKLLRYTDFSMPWGNYYLVTTKAIKANDLTMTYNTTNDLNVTLKFRKISKSMYWNPKIKLHD